PVKAIRPMPPGEISRRHSASSSLSRTGLTFALPLVPSDIRDPCLWSTAGDRNRDSRAHLLLYPALTTGVEALGPLRSNNCPGQFPVREPAPVQQPPHDQRKAGQRDQEHGGGNGRRG